MRARRAVPFLLFGVALALRLHGIDWDQGLLFHPDERRIAQAVLGISFSPLRLDPGFYAYGSLPFYLARAGLALAAPFGAPLDFRGAVLAGRVLSAIWGAAAVPLLWLLGRRLFGERAGRLAALLLAIAVLPVQNAHFATNDVALTTLALAALLLLVAAAEPASLPLFTAAGLVFGLAMATKVSALPLLGAAAAALAFAAHSGVARASSCGALFGAGALAGFAAGEPWAFVAPGAFLHAVAEQGAMARSAGSVPYTIQYVGTLPYLYPIRELVTWGLGPALGVAALWGTWRALRRRAAPGVVVALAFFLPFVAVTGAFGVKFPRYLLPAYPLLVLFAAAALAEVPGRAGRLVRGAVLALSAAYLAAFLSIYGRDHTVREASAWAYAHIPTGANIVVPTWEEGFPAALPEGSPDRYRVTAFPFYDEDGAGKTRAFADALAHADAVVFPTNRIPGAVLRDSARFPETARALRLLFAGDLGFPLVRSVASRPALLGVSLPDELADESFSVYDHPRVTIFRNAARLPAAELERRLASWSPGRVLSRENVILCAPVPFASTALPGARRNSLLALLAVWALVSLLAETGAALALRAFGEAPGVRALGHVLGVTLFAWLAFLGTTAGIPFARPLLVVLALALVLAGALPGSRRPPSPARERWVPHALFTTVYLAFAGIRAWAPEVYWGEKPMDLSILGALGRSVSLPPPEPWFAGSALQYTWFGHFTVAALGKTFGIAPGLLFNLGIAATAGLFACALLFAGSAVAGTLRGGGGAVLLGLVAGNLAAVPELFRRRALDFDLFWSVSRVVPGAINEFPFWSFVFADLHAHVLALPLATAAIGALVHAVIGSARPGALPITALLLGALVATNGWSAPSAAAVTLLLSLAGAWGRPAPALARAAAGAGRAILLALLAWVAFLPLWDSFHGPPPRVEWNRDAFARPHEMLLVFGLFVVLLAPSAWGALRALARTRAGAAAAAAAILLLALVAPAALRHGRLLEADSTRGLAAVLAILAGLAAISAADVGRRLALLLASAAFAGIALCEVVTLWDRMNTVFKFWLDAWVLLAVACGTLAADLFGRAARRAATLPARAELPVRAAFPARAALALAIATSGIALAGWMRSRHVEGPRGTLDGTAYLAAHAPADAAAIAWLNANVPGLPTVAEAWGPSYRETARVSMNTGLPIVVGWDYHLVQRAQEPAAIEERVRDVGRLYRTTDAVEALALLRRWRVEWVFCGDEERRAYGPDTAERLARLAPALTPAFRTGGTTLFRVTP